MSNSETTTLKSIDELENQYEFEFNYLVSEFFGIIETVPDFTKDEYLQALNEAYATYKGESN